jgi:hypothetical protein
VKQGSGQHRPAPDGKRMAPAPKAPASVSNTKPPGGNAKRDMGGSGSKQPRGMRPQPHRRQVSAATPHTSEGLKDYLRGKEF